MIKASKKEVLFVCENFGAKKPKFVNSVVDVDIMGCFIMQYNIDTELIKVKKNGRMILGDNKLIKMIENKINSIILSNQK